MLMAAAGLCYLTDCSATFLSPSFAFQPADAISTLGILSVRGAGLGHGKGKFIGAESEPKPRENMASAH